MTADHSGVDRGGPMIQQIRYRVKVHPVDENGCRAHVYYDDAPWRSDVDRMLGETGIGFETHGGALETAHYWADLDILVGAKASEAPC